MKRIASIIFIVNAVNLVTSRKPPGTLLSHSERRGVLAHEASHMFHTAFDFYYKEVPYLRIRDAFAWGLLYE